MKVMHWPMCYFCNVYLYEKSLNLSYEIIDVNFIGKFYIGILVLSYVFKGQRKFVKTGLPFLAFFHSCQRTESIELITRMLHGLGNKPCSD